MAESKVSWMHWPHFGGRNHNWTPFVGCTPASPGCDRCWARRLEDGRLRHLNRCARKPWRDATLPPTFIDFAPETPRMKYFWRGPVYQGDAKLREPLRWRKPALVWCCPSSDPFHEDIRDEAIDKMLAVAALCPQHFFLFLTKRAERMERHFYASPVQCVYDAVAAVGGSEICHVPWPLPNVGLGVTVCNQAEADAKIPLLLQTPAAMRFVSIEPYLSSIDLYSERHDYLGDLGRPGGPVINHGPDFVIVGCESGPRRRHIGNEHILSVVRQCAAADVRCFVKQVEIGGRVSRDPSEWIEELRVQQFPAPDRAELNRHEDLRGLAEAGRCRQVCFGGIRE